MKPSGHRFLVLLILSLVLVARAQQPSQLHPPYETRADHDPNGTGIFYMGREIAQVMGHQAADWLERPEREKEENSSQAIAALDLKPGHAVADIGAGTGYYTRRMAQLVGTNGTVYAVDIQQEMLDLLTNK